MHIVLLPNTIQSRQIDSLRKQIYLGSYRIFNKNNPSKLHITLTQIKEPSKVIFQNLTIELDLLANQTKTINITKNKYRLELQTNNEYSWIGIIIKHKNIDELREYVEQLTESLDINDSSEYLKRMPNKKFQTHMNLSNYTKTHKAETVFNMFRKRMPTTIELNRLGIRDNLGKIIWETELS